MGQTKNKTLHTFYSPNYIKETNTVLCVKQFCALYEVINRRRNLIWRLYIKIYSNYIISNTNAGSVSIYEFLR